MDLPTLLFRLPFLPLTGFIRLAETIAQEAERELHDPARIRRELDELQREQESGEISAAQAAEREDSLAATMVTGRGGPAAPQKARRASPARRRRG
jgi:hypothetical protein